MAKIISVGAAVQDVTLSGKVFKAVCEFDEDCVAEFPLGAKLDVDDILITTGGGATNAAVTFARQGHHSEFIGVVGNDAAGDMIVDALKAENVSVDNIIKTDKYHTGYSTLLLSPSGERTILVYRGASQHFEKSDFEIENIEGDWLYITSLAGNLELLEYLLVLAESKNMKVAVDPGHGELEQTTKLKKLIPRLTVLKANRDELGLLTGGGDAESIARDLASQVPYIIVTDGAAGCVASDGSRLIRAGMYEDVTVLDRTGAGDAFGSGFVSAIARGESLEAALTLGSANSTSVVQKVGAKQGILSKDAKLHDMQLTVLDL